MIITEAGSSRLFFSRFSFSRSHGWIYKKNRDSQAASRFGGGPVEAHRQEGLAVPWGLDSVTGSPWMGCCGWRGEWQFSGLTRRWSENTRCDEGRLVEDERQKREYSQKEKKEERRRWIIMSGSQLSNCTSSLLPITRPDHGFCLSLSLSILSSAA